jgi:hypothetical protein
MTKTTLRVAQRYSPRGERPFLGAVELPGDRRDKHSAVRAARWTGTGNRNTRAAQHATAC